MRGVGIVRFVLGAIAADPRARLVVRRGPRLLLPVDEQLVPRQR
jgi:hypothetical protein